MRASTPPTIAPESRHSSLKRNRSSRGAEQVNPRKGNSVRLSWLLLLLVSTIVQSQPAYQPDYAREKRWADEITPGLVVGDAIYLQQKSGHKFLAIYTE